MYLEDDLCDNNVAYFETFINAFSLLVKFNPW